VSVVAGRGFRVERIRARRTRPGLRPQHLAAVLAARDVSGADVTGAEVCAWTEQVRQRFWTGLEAALPMAAAALPDLTEPQWQHLQRRQAERLAQAREDYLQPRREDRLAAALERAVERAEDFYGPLLPAQRDLLAAATAASPLAPESWLAQREARQRTLVQALREAQRLPDPARRLAALRVAADAYGRRPPGAEGERQARWQAHNCETAARLHASATPAQREHLRDRLAAWEEDLRALAAAGAP